MGEEAGQQVSRSGKIKNLKSSQVGGFSFRRNKRCWLGSVDICFHYHSLSTRETLFSSFVSSFLLLNCYFLLFPHSQQRSLILEHQQSLADLFISPLQIFQWVRRIPVKAQLKVQMWPCRRARTADFAQHIPLLHPSARVNVHAAHVRVA